MWNPFKRYKHPDVNFYQFHQGRELNSGEAQRSAFDQALAYPVVLYHGTGTPVRELNVLQPPQVFQSLALPSKPYQGTAVGTLQYQGLLDSEPSIQ